MKSKKSSSFHDEDEGVKGNKKGGPQVWTFVKNASLAITIFLFFITIVLVLDAYKFVSVRVSIDYLHLIFSGVWLPRGGFVVILSFV